MKQIVAITKPFRAQAVLEAIGDFSVDSVMVNETTGFGLTEVSTLGDYGGINLPKIEISVWVTDDLVDPVLDRIVDVARTGRVGDGKIFVFPVLGDFDF